MDTKNLSDRDLYSLCKKYGEQALYWRRKFIGLLPEVFKRKLYELHGFNSIFEFAAKLAGVSEEQVRRTLNLEKKFENMPILRSALVSGEVSISKLAKVASIATFENQECLMKQAQTLSSRALETLARDERLAMQQIGLEIKNVTNDIKSVPGNTSVQLDFTTVNNTKNSANEPQNQLQLLPEIQAKLLELQQKGIDINELLKEFLAKREKEIKEEKEKIAKKLAAKDQQSQKQSKHIPAIVKRVLKREYGEKCSIATCKRPAENLHHTLRFALHSTHDPHYIAPLCREHHLIAHSIDLKFQKMRKFTTATQNRIIKHNSKSLTDQASFVAHS